MELTPFELTQKSYRVLLRAELRRQYRWMLWLGAVSFILSVAGGVFLLVTVGVSGAMKGCLPLAILSVVFVFFPDYITWHLARHPLNRFQFGTYFVRVDAESIVFSTNTGRVSSLPLVQIVKVSEHPNWHLVYENTHCAFPVARSAFPNPNAEREFVTMIEEAMQPTA